MRSMVEGARRTRCARRRAPPAPASGRRHLPVPGRIWRHKQLSYTAFACQRAASLALVGFANARPRIRRRSPQPVTLASGAHVARARHAHGHRAR